MMSIQQKAEEKPVWPLRVRWRDMCVRQVFRHYHLMIWWHFCLPHKRRDHYAKCLFDIPHSHVMLLTLYHNYSFTPSTNFTSMFRKMSTCVVEIPDEDKEKVGSIFLAVLTM